MTRTLALVESPAQLINVVEWAHQTGRAGSDQGRSAAITRTGIAVLLPVDSLTRYQLAVTAAIARSAGLRVDTYELRRGTPTLLREGAELLTRLARADRLVIGDPFSGVIQTILPASRARSVVIVDDGTATLEYVDCVRAGRPLTRWRQGSQPGSQPGLHPGSHQGGASSARAKRATRRLTPREGRPVSLFTAMPTAAAMPGGETTANLYAWTRQRSEPLVDPLGADVIGASLVETGIIQRAAYVGAVERLAHQHGATRYLAHRRENPDKLAEIARRTGLTIVRPDVPIELALRAGPVAATVLTFPSTPAYTLPLVLAGTGVITYLCPVHPSWFTASATTHARDFLQRVTDWAGARRAAVPVLPVTL